MNGQTDSVITRLKELATQNDINVELGLFILFGFFVEQYPCLHGKVVEYVLVWYPKLVLYNFFERILAFVYLLYIDLVNFFFRAFLSEIKEDREVSKSEKLVGEFLCALRHDLFLPILPGRVRNQLFKQYPDSKLA